ncbi:MAG: hypothetical protein F6K31_36875 [Symploca sp. SIO2G7]|nr:hypothetical protein [Symploca sp. SIO2G7]
MPKPAAVITACFTFLLALMLSFKDCIIKQRATAHPATGYNNSLKYNLVEDSDRLLKLVGV